MNKVHNLFPRIGGEHSRRQEKIAKAAADRALQGVLQFVEHEGQEVASDASKRLDGLQKGDLNITSPAAEVDAAVASADRLVGQQEAYQKVADFIASGGQLPLFEELPKNADQARHAS